MKACSQKQGITNQEHGVTLIRYKEIIPVRDMDIEITPVRDMSYPSQRFWIALVRFMQFS